MRQQPHCHNWNHLDARQGYMGSGIDRLEKNILQNFTIVSKVSRSIVGTGARFLLTSMSTSSMPTQTSLHVRVKRLQLSSGDTRHVHPLGPLSLATLYIIVGVRGLVCKMRYKFDVPEEPAVVCILSLVDIVWKSLGLHCLLRMK